MYSLPINMLIQCVVVLLCLNCVRTTLVPEKRYSEDHVTDFTNVFSWWPSMHNAARMLRNKREVPDPIHVQGQSEGGSVDAKPLETLLPATNITQPSAAPTSEVKDPIKNEVKNVNSEPVKDTPQKGNNTVEPAPTVATIVEHDNGTKTNLTVTDKSTAKIDFNSPGVLKRGFIVFGGFALMAIAYLIFYRRKGKKNDTNNTSTIDANQFRYGVLQSEDQRDNLELSRVPLTMESDDDEDEDLEIFDLEQKKKSLSYVNLQMNDEDIVLNSSDNRGNERDNLLLDIDDANSETLINWSSNGNKSIL